jgi:hypothetical protein
MLGVVVSIIGEDDATGISTRAGGPTGICSFN